MKNTFVGIYKIWCETTRKSYIGSSVDIKKRLARHRDDLRKNQHHSIHLQRVWNKHGEKKFVFTMIEFCERDSLVEREKYWIDHYKSSDPEKGYNILPIPNSTFGRVVSDATRAKMRASRLRYQDSEATKKKRADHNRGSKSHFAKLNESQVKEIKLALERGTTQAELSRIYQVTRTCINDIVKGRTWNHL